MLEIRGGLVSKDLRDHEEEKEIWYGNVVSPCNYYEIS